MNEVISQRTLQALLSMGDGCVPVLEKTSWGFQYLEISTDNFSTARFSHSLFNTSPKLDVLSNLIQTLITLGRNKSPEKLAPRAANL